MSLAQALAGNYPSFGSSPQVQVAPTDTIGPQMAAYQAQLANWQAEQNQQNALMGGLFGLAGSALTAGLMPGGWLTGLIGGGAAAPNYAASMYKMSGKPGFGF